jgi:hypothetical protein
MTEIAIHWSDLSMHARMDQSVKTPGDMAEWSRPRKGRPDARRITGELPIGRSPDSRTETDPFRRIAFPSFEAQWQLMRLGSITVAGAVLELPSWRLTSFP